MALLDLISNSTITENEQRDQNEQQIYTHGYFNFRNTPIAVKSDKLGSIGR